jgi:hypothetical protein
MDISTGLIKREFGIWIQYFIISFIAASVPYLYDIEQGLQSSADQGLDINIVGLYRRMWHGYYKWWLYTFIGLSVIRMLILMILWRFKQASTVS